jgi:hypothetical protein
MSQILEKLHAHMAKIWNNAVIAFENWVKYLDKAYVGIKNSSEFDCKSPIPLYTDPDLKEELTAHKIWVKMTETKSIQQADQATEKAKQAVDIAKTATQHWAKLLANEVENQPLQKVISGVWKEWIRMAVQIDATLQNLTPFNMEKKEYVTVVAENTVMMAAILVKKAKKCSENVASLRDISIEVIQLITSENLTEKVANIAHRLEAAAQTGDSYIAEVKRLHEEIAPLFRRVDMRRKK